MPLLSYQTEKVWAAADWLAHNLFSECMAVGLFGKTIGKEAIGPVYMGD